MMSSLHSKPTVGDEKVLEDSFLTVGLVVFGLDDEKRSAKNVYIFNFLI